jgi:hypothetical protein
MATRNELMPVYTVHEPPPRQDDDMLAHTSRFVFVRDGFHFWAFLLTPLWLLRYRLWLEFIVYALLAGGVTFALRRLGIESAGAWVGLLLAILAGIEASSLRRWKLSRKGYENLGVVVADDLESAERRFFDGWVAQDGRSDLTAMPPAPPAASPFGPPPGNEIVGLFPQPEARP